jgi:hypothetical protein
VSLVRGNPLFFCSSFFAFFQASNDFRCAAYPSSSSSSHFFSLQPEYGQDNTTAWLTTVLGNHTNLIDAAEQEYSIGSTADGWPIADDYDQISAIFTDAVYQCPMSMVANDSLSAGIPTWRYLYNATFPDIQPLPGLGVFHGSEGMPSIFTLLRLCSRFFFGPSYSCPPTDPLRWSPSPLSRLDLVCGSRPTKQSWMLYLHPPISLVVKTSLTGSPQNAFLFFFFKPKHQSIPFLLPPLSSKSFC